MRWIKNARTFSLCFALLFHVSLAYTQSGYASRENHLKKFDFSNRKLPEIPDKSQKIRVIIDTDAKNEIDDQWAITLALLSGDRLQIEGFVAANYDNRHGGPEGIEKSYQEILLLLKKSGFTGEFPVYRGSHPMRYNYEPSESEGVDFIIRKAMESSPSDPIWVVALGSATNLASAYLKQPEIIDRVVFFWHGRTRWPDKCWNFNVFGDRRAAITLFHAPVPLVLFDTGTYLTCPMEESEKHVRPYGEIGKYLHDFRHTNPYFMRSDKGFFDLGDIAALVDPDLALWQEVSCPEIDPDLTYKFKGTKGKILRCYHIDRDKTFQLLYDELKGHYPGETQP
jgi:inosine-uridine nucleoside N-ribohydrolase